MQKLLRFSETETDAGYDLLHAAELTFDPLLGRLADTRASVKVLKHHCRAGNRTQEVAGSVPLSHQFLQSHQTLDRAVSWCYT